LKLNLVFQLDKGIVPTVWHFLFFILFHSFKYPRTPCFHLAR